MMYIVAIIFTRCSARYDVCVCVGTARQYCEVVIRLCVVPLNVMAQFRYCGLRLLCVGEAVPIKVGPEMDCVYVVYIQQRNSISHRYFLV